jgi:large subunit ribosomal protein L22
MEVQALTRYARMSPEKLREVTRVIQGLSVAKATDLLTYIPKKSARLIAKTLKSAVANAENNHNLSSASLVVRSATADIATPARRFKAGPRGSGMAYRKRMAHIRIILAEGQATSAAEEAAGAKA